MEEQGIVWPRVLDQPVHGSQYVCLGWLAHWVLLVVGQGDHILPLVAEELVQIGAHILHVVDASPKLTALAKVVDTNQQRFPSPVTCRVLERVAVWCAVAKVLCAARWWWRRAVVSVCPLIAGGCWHHTWYVVSFRPFKRTIGEIYLVGALVAEAEGHSFRIAVVAVPMYVSPSDVAEFTTPMRTWLYPYCCGGGVGCP